MNGIIYCRVSSKEQVEGTSLETQEVACREYARSHRISVLRIFVERGESAKIADRTQLIELLEFCRKNKGNVDALLVWKVDRFARNVGDHFNIKASLMKYGVRVVSVTEPIDGNPEGKLMETILAGFAQFDNDVRATRTVQGMRRKLQEGLFPWRPPYGYKSASQNGEKKTQPDEPHQPTFSLLQKVWKEFATGEYTKSEIQRLMTSWGVQAQGGEPISHQSLDNLFRNNFYAGILVDPWSGEEHEGKHIPMVTREDFARVQQILSRRNRSLRHQKHRPEFPLRGLIRCSQCRGYMTGSFSRGRSRRYPYYHCSRSGCGQRTTYGTETLHNEFSAFLTEIAPNPELIARLQELILQEAKSRHNSARAKKTKIETERARLKRQSEELIRMRTEGLITDEEFVAQKAVVTKRRAALESSPAYDQIDLDSIRADLQKITSPLAALEATWRRLPTPFQQRFERIVLPVGFVNGQIRTAELGLLFSTFGRLAKTHSNLVALWMVLSVTSKERSRKMVMAISSKKRTRQMIIAIGTKKAASRVVEVIGSQEGPCLMIFSI
jgi:DNA invertase Pin-like site-specific DNA recombinase